MSDTKLCSWLNVVVFCAEKTQTQSSTLWQTAEGSILFEQPGTWLESKALKWRFAVGKERMRCLDLQMMTALKHIWFPGNWLAQGKGNILDNNDIAKILTGLLVQGLSVSIKGRFVLRLGQYVGGEDWIKMSFRLFTVAAPGLRHALDQSLSVLRERERKTPITQCHSSFGVRLLFSQPTSADDIPRSKKKKRIRASQW